MELQVFSGASIFDGETLHHHSALVVSDGVVVAIEPIEEARARSAIVEIELDGGVLAPAFVDLKVNGGGGIMVDGDADAGRMAAICASHILGGCAGILPTLLTSAPDITRNVVTAAIDTERCNVPGFLGLHLEGPFIDIDYRGLHDESEIRPLGDEEMAFLCNAASALKVFKITLSPRQVSAEQITALTRAGALVSLGHTGCTWQQARAAFEAGAVCVTQLFEQMLPLSSDEPGLSGAVLDSDVAASLVAGSTSPSPPMLRLALKARPSGLFLVSNALSCQSGEDEAMSVWPDPDHIGSNSRALAGGDQSLACALEVLVSKGGAGIAQALKMVTSTPAHLIGQDDRLGYLRAGRRADMVRLDRDWNLGGVWWGGMALG